MSRDNSNVLLGESKNYQETVYVVQGLHQPLLRRPAIQALHLVEFIREIGTQQQVFLHMQYPKLFTGLGKMKHEYYIQLKERCDPYAVSSPRRVPIPLVQRVNEKLERLGEEGMIEKVEGPTDSRVCRHSPSSQIKQDS